ncbi:ZmpA/ZmpB/ZmpC family metallo-endopeptidase [Schaalia canis]|uniref:Peptidase M26 n=1 Tax=Schaalia canis TaxID=100469 RepID=A0A3P1SHB6_9ACTO|nr:ZmpA/ZmpB/ZmpC family metallo-endopeptidase [Schaalia canis]RRC96340.1 hypothetical protein EII11_01435 [Schaalia canis]
MSTGRTPSTMAKIARIGLASSVISTSVVAPALADDIDTNTAQDPSANPANERAESTRHDDTPAQSTEEAERALANAEEAARATQQEYASAQEELTSRTSEVNNAQELATNAQGVEQEALNEAETELRTAQEDARNVVQAHTVELTQAQALSQEALAEEEQTKQAAQQTQAELSRTQAEVEKVQAAFDAAITPADKPALGGDTQNAPARPSAQEIDTRATVLSADIATLDETIQRATASRDEAQTRKERAQTEVDNATRSLNTTQSALNDATTRHHEATQALQSAEENLRARQSEQEEAENTAGPDSAAHGEKTHELANAQAEHARLGEEITALSASIAQLEENITTLEGDLALKEDTLTQAQQSLNGITAELSTLDEQIQTATTKRQSLENELGSLESNKRALEERLATEESKDDGPGFSAEELVDTATLSKDLALFRHHNGRTERVTGLSARPDDLSGYFLRSILPDGRELSMDVTSIDHDASTPGAPFIAHARVPGNAGHVVQISLEILNSNAVPEGTHMSFSALLNALEQNPGGTHTLGADLYVDNVAGGATSYVTTPFSGVLNGNGFSINGLSKPLFSEMTTGAQVRDLTLDAANISSQEANTAALAQRTTGDNSRVTNVHVKGRIEGMQHVGGLIAQAQNTTIESSFFEGRVISNWRRNDSTIGGMIGAMSGGTLSSSGVSVIIDVQHREPNNRVGGLVGHLGRNARIEGSYVGGRLINGRGRGLVGGIVGSIQSAGGANGSVHRVVSAMNVNGGRIGLGDDAYAAGFSEIFYLEGEAAGSESAHPFGTTVNAADAAHTYTSLNLAHNFRDSAGANKPKGRIFDGVEGVRSERMQAYHNYALLLPMASREAIVRAANMLDDADPLVTKVLRAALPIIGGTISVDTLTGGEAIEGISLHYADNTVERRAVQAQQHTPAAQTFISYLMTGGLPYAPQTVTALPRHVISAIAQELAGVQFDAIDIFATLNKTQLQQEIVERMKASPNLTPEEIQQQVADRYRGVLYLRDTFNAQRPALEATLEKLLLRDRVIAGAGASHELLKEKVLANKEALLLGLAYVNKWYNVPLGDMNLRDLFVFRQDFYGSTQSPLDWLIALGKDHFSLDPRNNLSTYIKFVSPYTKQVNLADALEDVRQQFTTTADFDQWFRQTTKAFIVETPSREVPTVNVQASERFRGKKFQSYLLPLLTVSEDKVFVTVDMTSVAMGTFERYYDVKNATESQRVNSVNATKDKLRNYAKKYRDYFDMWYRISSDKVRPALINAVPVWDGFSYNGRWTPEYGPDTFRSVEEFFGPIGKWYPATGASAYSDTRATYMVVASMLTPSGVNTYTHEMVHNLDNDVFLGGEETRRHAQAEMYPTSFLQNPYSRNSDQLGFNQAEDFSTQSGRYLHNFSPDRFQTKTDLHQYFKGYFQALYVLDHAEAEAMLARSPQELSGMLMRLGSVHGGVLSANYYEALSAEQIEAMGLRSIDDLIDQSLMMRRRLGPTGVMERNGYPDVPILDPYYGTGESPVGLTGEAVFRRNALELLGAKGFDEGFVPYTSNKLAPEADAAGKPNLPDTFLMPRIFANDPYKTLADYRKHAYARARQRASTHLQPITLTFKGETITLRSFQEIVDRFSALLAEDIRTGIHGSTRSQAYAFKGEVFSALMRQSDEFKQSIFTDDADQLVPWVELPKPAAPVVAETQMLDAPAADRSSQRFARVELPQHRDEQLIDSLRSQIRDVQSGIAQKAGELRSTDEQVQNLQAQHAGATERHNTQTQVVAQARSARDTAQQSLAVQRQRLADLPAQREAKQQRQASVATEITSAQEALRAMDATVNRARQAVHDAQNQRQAQEHAAQDARQSLDNAQASYDEANALVRSAQNLLEGATQALSTADSTLAGYTGLRRAQGVELARLLALRSLARAYETAQEAERAASTGHQSAQERLERATHSRLAAMKRLETMTAELEALQNDEATLRAATVESLRADDTAARGRTELLAALTRLKEKAALTRSALDALATAQAALRVQEERVAQAQARHRQATDTVIEARALLEKLKQEVSPRRHEVPRTAPTVEPLPTFELRWEVPRTAPTVEELPTFDLRWEVPKVAPTLEPLPEGTLPPGTQEKPQERPDTAGAQQADTSDAHAESPGTTSDNDDRTQTAKTSASAQQSVKLAQTGSDLAGAGVLAALGGIAGLAALRGRRREN